MNGRAAKWSAKAATAGRGKPPPNQFNFSFSRCARRKVDWLVGSTAPQQLSSPPSIKQMSLLCLMNGEERVGCSAAFLHPSTKKRFFICWLGCGRGMKRNEIKSTQSFIQKNDCWLISLFIPLINWIGKESNPSNEWKRIHLIGFALFSSLSLSSLLWLGEWRKKVNGFLPNKQSKEANER